MNRIDHERQMTAGWLDFAHGREPTQDTDDHTPYAMGYRAARAKYARSPRRFKPGWKPRGVHTPKKITVTWTSGSPLARYL